MMDKEVNNSQEQWMVVQKFTQTWQGPRGGDGHFSEHSLGLSVLLPHYFWTLSIFIVSGHFLYLICAALNPKGLLLIDRHCFS